MTSEKRRANYISSILRALLVINILLFAIAAVWMFFTSNARDVYFFGTISCSCLITSVGFQLLSRWQRLGLYVVAGIYVLASIILYLYFPSEQVISIQNNYSKYLPVAITGGVIILLFVLLFVIKNGSAGKNCWAQMSDGADIKHFRHIYQLTTTLLLITVGLMFYLPTTKHEDTQDIKIEKAIVSTREVSRELLDSANVTLDEVISIEPMIDSIPSSLQLKYNKRIFALKHLLLSGIMANEHDTKDIINISKVHLGEFSESQQQILDWYLGLPKESQDMWIDCPPVTNLQEFKMKLTETIEK